MAKNDDNENIMVILLNKKKPHNTISQIHLLFKKHFEYVYTTKSGVENRNMINDKL